MFLKKWRISDKNHAFYEKWEMHHFTCNNNNKIDCMIWVQVISVNKECNVKWHYTTIHAEKYKKNTDVARKMSVPEFKEKLMQQVSIFPRVNRVQSLAPSYEVSLKLCKAKKLFSDGFYKKMHSRNKTTLYAAQIDEKGRISPNSGASNRKYRRQK